MRRIIAGMFLALSLVGCASSEEQVTPESCIVALDINAQMFEYLRRGDVDTFIKYGQDNDALLERAAEDCRSKAAPTT